MRREGSGNVYGDGERAAAMVAAAATRAVAEGGGWARVGRGQRVGSVRAGGSIRPGVRPGGGRRSFVLPVLQKKKPDCLRIRASKRMWQSVHRWQSLTRASSARTYRNSYFGP